MQNRVVLSAAALLLLGGSLSALHAEETALPAAAQAVAAAGSELPRFIPSAEAGSLDASFAPFAGEPGEIAIPAHAVDLDTIEPADEPDAEHLGNGVASYYGARFAGKPTASGERFDPQQLTAAHRTLPFGSMVRVTNPGNGQSVVVRINDRGPFHGNRTIDLSHRAAEQIGIVRAGHGTVRLDLLAS